jgi:AcrR family transcriptional regulator
MPKALKPARVSGDAAVSPELPRRSPTQERSRARLARILECAEALIAERGSDRLKMAEVAEAAGISIGSLYQYFPEKAAIIHALAGRYNAESRRCIVDALREVTDLPGLDEAFTALMQQFYALVRNGPVMRDIWAGMQTDRTLAALQLDESRAMGAVLADTVLRARPGTDRARVGVTALLLWELGEATVRLAIASDERTGRLMVSTFTTMALAELARVE